MATVAKYSEIFQSPYVVYSMLTKQVKATIETSLSNLILNPMWHL
jgi:hypothetical protein